MSESPIIAKINHVISSAGHFNDDQFRQVLEGLVKKGGKEAQMALVRYITSKEIPKETYLNIIRTAGYIRNPLYLVPLKKILDTNPDLNVKKEAILAMAKYNDRKALNILSASLETVSNPFLQKTINEKITEIRQNNPILSLLPRFLKGGKDYKAFLVTLGILKKILTPEDATFFLNYLKNDDPVIEKGAFEVLCYSGNINAKEPVFDFYVTHANDCKCLAEDRCDELLALTDNLVRFIDRFPLLLEHQLPYMKPLLPKVGDLRVQKVMISLFCRSRNPQIFAYLKEIYEQHDNLKESIIELSAGNAKAVDFLFERYETGRELKEKVIKALLMSERGLDYFITHFKDFDLNNQTMVVRNLPHTDNPKLLEFITSVMNTGAFGLKKYLVKSIRRNYFYSFKNMLFDPKREQEFFSMEDEYLETIFRIFPVTACKKMLFKIATEDLPLPQLEKYLEQIREATRKELVFCFNHADDGKILVELMKRIININSLNVTSDLLTTLTQIKTFDVTTYRNITNALNYFINVKSKEDSLPPEEKTGIKQVKENLKFIWEDVKRIESIEKELKLAVSKSVPDVLQLKRLVSGNGLPLAFKVKPLVELMADFFKNIDEKTIALWRKFFQEFPLVSRLVREERIRQGQTQATASDSKESLHDRLRIVISFKERDYTALFHDQFQEILPDFNLALDDEKLESTDIFLCDKDTFTEYMDKKKVGTKRNFVLLKHRDENAAVKEHSPRTFLQPIFAYRTARLMLQELYFLRT